MLLLLSECVCVKMLIYYFLCVLSDQWTVGMATFLLPCSPASLRKLVKPVHVFLGATILSLSVVSCISGINEKLFFVL